MTVPVNILDPLPANPEAELFTELINRRGVRIERIVSTGQATPPDQPYCQDHDEWVLLLAGAAGLWTETDGESRLRPGDAVMIPAGRRHRVTWTQADPATVWLAIHFPAPEG